MKRTSGRIGIGLVFASIWIGACMTNQDGRPVSTEAESPELGASGNSAARDVVLAVRGRLERANLPMGSAFSTGSRLASQSLDLLGKLPSAEHVNAFSPNGLLASPEFKASVALASRANGAFRVTDDQSRLSVDVSLRGATNSIREDVDDYSVYRSGYAHGSHVVHRISEQGTEDYVFFPDELPATPELRYDVALGQDVAGLRLVSNTLELLDNGGVPRLRMAPPYAVDGDGKKVSVNVAIEGCAYDTSVAMPWGRPAVEPGARQCTVHLTWDGSVKAPLVVDPAWRLTKNMNAARVNMTATLDDTGSVIVTGGDGGPGTPILNTTEYYDHASFTWSPGPTLSPARTEHAAVFFKNVDGKFLYLFGGRVMDNQPTQTTNTATKLNLGTGNWLTVPEMMTPRRLHTATLLSSGILVAGGATDMIGSPTGSAEFYSTTLYTWAQTPMSKARVGHTATRVGDSLVLVAGGLGGPDASTTLEVFDAAKLPANPWTPVTGPAPHAHVFHTATAMPDGRILLVGGVEPMASANANADLCKLTSANMMYTCTWEPNMPAMNNARGFAAAALLPASETVVVMGGRPSIDPGIGPVSFVESWTKGATQWVQLPNMKKPRANFSAVTLSSQYILAIGGVAGQAASGGTAEFMGCSTDAECTAVNVNLYCAADNICRSKKIDGKPCDIRAADAGGADCSEANCNQCASGPNHCVDGVCCNSECTGSCEACNQNGKCKPIVGAPIMHNEPDDFNLPKRAACSDHDTCGGSCNGILPACNYPSGNTCETICQGSAIEVKTCDGMGACGCAPGMPCIHDKLESCSPYSCDPDKMQCHIDCTPAVPADMTPQVGCDDATAVCNADNKQCIPTPTQCDQKNNEMVLSNGTRISCGFFQCVSGACLTVCDTAYDCLPDLDGNGNRKYVCDEARRCVPFADADTTEVPDVTCSTSPVNQSSRFGWLAALALAGAFAARRNRARA